MAPEQLQGKEADARPDIFSFGCLFYEMLTGKRAFDGSDPASVIAAILERPSPPLLVASSTPALEHVLQKCLAKDRDQRWQSARDLRVELAWIARSGFSRSSGEGTGNCARTRNSRLAAKNILSLSGISITGLPNER
jgi:serine/threonine protein kinase